MIVHLAAGTRFKYATGIALFVVLVVAFSAMRGWVGCQRSLPPKQSAAPIRPIRPVRPDKAPVDQPLAPAPPLDPAERSFADRIVAASNLGDLAKKIEMLAPAVRECVNDDTRAFFERDLGRAVPAPIPADYTARFESLERGEITARRGLALPVPPTHQLTITYSSGGNEIELNSMVALVEGRWYLVAPCPGDQFIAGITRRAEERKRLNEEAARVFSSLDGSTRQAVSSLLAQGNKSEAYMELRRRHELSPPVAARIIRRFEQEATAAGGVKPRADPSGAPH
ncbi:MAG: hypothetical protein ACREQB_12270 [Candidatus Binataceae bacterium]